MYRNPLKLTGQSEQGMVTLKFSTFYKNAVYENAEWGIYIFINS